MRHGRGRMMLLTKVGHVRCRPVIGIESVLTPIHAGPAVGTRSFCRSLCMVSAGVRGLKPGGRSPFAFIRFSIILARTMLPHAHITSNTDSAALISNEAAQLGALAEAGKLLCAEDLEGPGSDIKTRGHILKVQGRLWFSIILRAWRGRKLTVKVCIFCLFSAFEQTEAETIPAFITDGEVGEDEISCLFRTLEIIGTGKIDALQRRDAGRSMQTTACYRPSILQRGTEDEGGIMLGGDVGPLYWSLALAFKDAKLDDGRRIYRATVG